MKRRIMENNISRREFIKLSLVASSALGLSLVGCNPASGDDPKLAVVDEWISALNAGEAERFAQLHTDGVFATTYKRKVPVSGRDKLYRAYSLSTQNEIDKIISFRQGGLICMIVNAFNSTNSKRSLCYIFNLAGELIDQVYEYQSGFYSLGSSPDFPGIELVQGDEGLSDRLAIMEDIFVDGLNNRDFSIEEVTESVLNYGPTQSTPMTGKDNFIRDGENYAQMFSSVRHEKIHAFGQGNLVCLHVKVENTSKGGLCFVADFDNGKIASLYQFWSEARL